jgi:hypothetical protein
MKPTQDVDFSGGPRPVASTAGGGGVVGDAKESLVDAEEHLVDGGGGVLGLARRPCRWGRCSEGAAAAAGAEEDATAVVAKPQCHPNITATAVPKSYQSGRGASKKDSG